MSPSIPGRRGQQIRSRRAAAVAWLAAVLWLAVVTCLAPAAPAQDLSRAVIGEPRSYPLMNYDEYRGDLALAILTLNQFWSETFPAMFRGEYSPPEQVVAYDPATGDLGLPCGPLEPPGPKNATYCFGNDTIQWDEPGLLLWLYNDVGDFAAMFTIAHEWGHAIQARLGILTGPSITKAKELQADCFGGAWAAYVEAQPILSDSTRVYLQQGDIDEATLGLFMARDPQGTPWFDPQAHGTGNQRIRAFNDGFDGGVRRCIQGDRPRELKEEQPS